MVSCGSEERATVPDLIIIISIQARKIQFSKRCIIFRIPADGKSPEIQ
jgi:hypothetical protein